MKNRYSKLLGNSVIFAIANIGTKLMQFVMVPLYTYVLSTSDFGKVDLISTTVSMIAPMISLSIYDAVFRFVMDKGSDKNAVFMSGLFVILCSVLIILLCTPILRLLDIPFVFYTSFILILTLFINLLQNFARAAGFVRIFAFSGIVSATSLVILNVFFLVVFNFGIDGYLLGIITSFVVTIGYLCLRMKIWHYFNIKYVKLPEIKKMLHYSIPLIPNAFSWWFTNDANKYFILLFVGSSGNGLYAVANKVPTIITTFFNIFNQAWQLSAVEEFTSDDRSQFYEKILNFIISFSLLSVAGILVILKPFMLIFTSPSFYGSWEFVPFLLIAVCYSNISAFYGTIFIAQKETASILSTTIYGMIINLLVNLILIPTLGVNGAGIGSSLGFLCVWALRAKLANKIMIIKIELKRVLTGHIIIIIMIIIEYFNNGIQLFFIELVFFLTIVALFHNEIFLIFKLFKKMVNSRRG